MTQLHPDRETGLADQDQERDDSKVTTERTTTERTTSEPAPGDQEDQEEDA